MQIRDNPVPLFLPLVAVVSGIVSGLYFKEYGYYIFLVGGAILFSLSLTILILKRTTLSFLIFLLSLIFFSSANYIYKSIPSVDDISQILPFEGSISGKVLLPTRHIIIKVSKIKMPENKNIKSIQSVSKTEALAEGVYKWNPASGKVIIRWRGDIPPPAAEVILNGKFYKPLKPLNPGQFNFSRHLANQGIFTQGDIKSIRNPSNGETIEIVRSKKRFLSELIGNTREYVKEKISAYLPEKEGGVLSGMILGVPGMVEDETIKHFRAAGVMHILAVSGLHVGLILFAFYYLLTALGLKKQAALIISLSFMILYVLISGARPSAVRAAIMLTMIVAGDILGGRGNVFNSLCLAALVLLGISPGLIFTAGFQLSFLAVGGIIYISPSLRNFIGRPLAVSVSAVISILPVLGWSFHYLPLLAPLTNLLIIPLASMALTLGLFFLALGGVWGFLAEIYAISVLYLLKIIGYITEFIYTAGIGGVYISRPPVFLIAGFYLLLIAAGVKKRRFIILAAVLMLISSVAVRRYFRKDFIAAIKYGESVCYVVKEYPGNAHLIVGKKDVSERTLVGFLYNNGIRKLNNVYIVHPVYNRMDNLAEVVKRFKADKIYYPGIYGNEFHWYNFKNKVGVEKIIKVKYPDVIDANGITVRILEPKKKYLDIRDNYIQMEFSGKKKIFVYAGGDIPKTLYDVIIAVEPYSPDFKKLKGITKDKIIYSGDTKSPDSIIHIKEKGEIFFH